MQHERAMKIQSNFILVIIHYQRHEPGKGKSGTYTEFLVGITNEEDVDQGDDRKNLLQY